MAGVGESPELLGVSPVEAEPVMALVPTCSGVWAVPRLPAAPVGEAGPGCVVGDVVCTWELRWVEGAGPELVVGSSAGGLVVVTAGDDVEAAAGEGPGEGEGVEALGSGVVGEGVGVGPCTVLAAGGCVGTCTVGPCAWGLVVGAGLAVAFPGVCSEGPGVPVGLPVSAVVTAVVWALVAGAADVAVLGTELLPGTWARGVLGGGSPVVVVGTAEVGDEGAREAAPPVVPCTVAGAVCVVLFVVPAVMAVEAWPVTTVPAVSALVCAGAGVLLSVPGAVPTGASRWTSLFHVPRGMKGRASGDATRLSDKDKEETHRNTRAAHILRPGRAGWLLRLVTAPSCPAREPEAAAQGALLGWAIFLVGELRAGHWGRAR